MGGAARVALLVDDDELSNAMIVRVLAPLYGVLTTTTVEHAKEILAARRVDIALVMAKLGAGSGAELIHWIRERHPATATMLMDRLGPVELALEADRCDATACLVKPFTEERLLKTVHSIGPARTAPEPGPSGFEDHSGRRR